jgi:hypothetical protein
MNKNKNNVVVVPAVNVEAEKKERSLVGFNSAFTAGEVIRLVNDTTVLDDTIYTNYDTALLAALEFSKAGRAGTLNVKTIRGITVSEDIGVAGTKLAETYKKGHYLFILRNRGVSVNGELNTTPASPKTPSKATAEIERLKALLAAAGVSA